jgi:hypothetical protein
MAIHAQDCVVCHNTIPDGEAGDVLAHLVHDPDDLMPGNELKIDLAYTR